jgi:hypothetical protein
MVVLSQVLGYFESTGDRAAFHPRVVERLRFDVENYIKKWLSPSRVNQQQSFYPLELQRYAGSSFLTEGLESQTKVCASDSETKDGTPIDCSPVPREELHAQESQSAIKISIPGHILKQKSKRENTRKVKDLKQKASQISSQ